MYNTFARTHTHTHTYTHTYTQGAPAEGPASGGIPGNAFNDDSQTSDFLEKVAWQMT